MVGLPDPAWGEMVCAVVVVGRRAHGRPTLDELRRLVRPKLAPFKHPRQLRLVDVLPRTASTGQVQRRLLSSSWRPADGGCRTVFCSD